MVKITEQGNPSNCYIVSPLKKIKKKGIWIAFGEGHKLEAQYKGGKLLNAKGELYNGDGVKVNNGNNLAITDQYLEAMVKALDKISVDDKKQGLSLVSSLQDSEFKLTFGMFTSNIGKGEPIKSKVIGLNLFIKLMIQNDVDSIDDLREHYNNQQTKATADLEIGGKRYLYSERWGWLDMKHFAAAAEGTDRWYATGDMVLNKGESIENQQKTKESGSSYAYEDLPSNLLGVYFEEWIENDKSTSEELSKLGREELKIDYDEKNEFPLKLYIYLKKLGFLDHPERSKDYKNIPHTNNDATSLRGLKNKAYKPHSETVTKKLDKNIDIDIINRSRKYKGLDEIEKPDNDN